MANRPGAIIAIFTIANTLSITTFQFLAPLFVELAREFHVSVPVAAQVTVAITVPWALAGPVLGPLSDRYGRRPVIITAALGVGLTTVAAAVAPSLPALAALRFLTGCFAAGLAPTILASTGDLFEGPARTRAYGWVNGGFAFAALVGVPAAAALAGVTNWRVTCLVVGALTTSIALLLGRVPFAGRGGAALSYRAGYGRLLRRPDTWLILVSNGLERALYSAAATYVPSYLIQRYGLTLGAVAPVLALIAIGGLAGNLVGGRTGGAVPAAKAFAWCQFGAGVLAAGALVSHPSLVLGSVMFGVFGLVNAYSRPPFLTLVSNVTTTARGSMLGLLATSNQGGFTVGAALGGLALALGDYPAVGALAGGLGFGAALVATALNAFLVNRKPRRAPEVGV